MCAGDSSALLRGADEPDDDVNLNQGAAGTAAAVLAASRGRSAHPQQPVPGLTQQANAAKVNLTEVRLQLQRQLKQQVSCYSTYTVCWGRLGCTGIRVLWRLGVLTKCDARVTGTEVAHSGVQCFPQGCSLSKTSLWQPVG